MTAIASVGTTARLAWEYLFRNQAKPTTTEDGVTQIGLKVPLSHYLSDEARQAAIQMMCHPPKPRLGSIEALRQSMDEQYFAPMLGRMRERYAVSVVQREIAGVRCDVVAPVEGVAADRRDLVLLNLHGGGFMLGSGLGALIESVPIAALSRMQVITVDYRQSPECRLPETLAEVTRVYRALASEYGADRIGVYGCSAGGVLAAMLTSRLISEGAALPRALGMLCCSGDMAWEGDSRFLAPALCGQPAPGIGSDPLLSVRDYVAGLDLKSNLHSPISSLELLARFPPTLLLSGTRSFELSSAVYTHSRMTKAGVDARLHVWEGMWHGFLYESALPESREAYDVIVRFFERTLR
jgi:monoterpene epsilon-lactone hydrolase